MEGAVGSLLLGILLALYSYVEGRDCACHARARTPLETDWARIVVLYTELTQLTSSTGGAASVGACARNNRGCSTPLAAAGFAQHDRLWLLDCRFCFGPELPRSWLSPLDIRQERGAWSFL